MELTRATNWISAISQASRTVNSLASGADDRLMAWRARPLRSAIDADRKSLSAEDGEELSYYADTSAPGRPLLLIHGVHAAASAREMKPLFDHYRRSRPVFAMDLPGFGFSSRRPGPYAPGVFVKAVLDVLRDIGISNLPPDVVALSLSSEFAAQGAYLNPELVHSLALISPTGFGLRQRRDGPVRRGLSRAGARALKVPLIGGGAYQLLVSRPGISYFLRKSFRGSVDKGLKDYCYATSHQPGARHAPIAFIAGSLFTPAVRETVYSKVKVPVAVLYDQDPYTSFRALPRFVQRHDNWKAIRVTPSKGLPQFDVPERTFSELDQWFRDLEQLRALHEVVEQAAP